MVKVYKCHNFKAQNVVQVDGEPVAFYNYKEKLFIATNQCTIEVFSLENPISKISCFSTESTVHDIVYCHHGNYVATVESKHSRKKNFYSVKVYLNWEIGHQGQHSKQKTSVRLAGKHHTVKPSSIEESCIQVIDMPSQHKIESINVCQRTGNLITVFKEITFVYRLEEKTIANSDKSYLDVVLFLQLEWHIGQIKKTVLCEDFIGVLSKKEVQVVKVIYSDENVGRHQQSHSAEIDRHSSSTRGSVGQQRKTSSVLSNFSLYSSKSSLSLPDTPQFSRIGCRSSANASPSLSVTKSYESISSIRDDDNFVKVNLEELKANQGQQTNKGIKTIYLKNLYDRHADKPTEPIVTDLRGGGHQTAGLIQVITLHHQKCNRAEDEWQHLQLVPSYIANISKLPTRAMTGSVPLRSVMYSSLVGICCFVSSDCKGYLYDIWSSTATQISTYSYSDIPKQIIMNQDLLYVLTERGLEIYTSRCGAAAIHHTDRFNSKDKAFPPADMDTCLCGVHLFMNTTRLDVSDNFVIILSKAEGVHRSDEGAWCLYAVEKCSPAELYKDMVRYGEKSRKTNELTYLNLLLEGHMTLRNTFIGVDVLDQQMADLFRESCMLIGQYYAKDNSKSRHLCIPYLSMSGLSVAEVIRQLVADHEKLGCQEYGQGFIAYLKHVLLQDGEPFELIEAEGDMILSICSKAIPDQLSEVIMFSRVKEYSTDHALSLMESWIHDLASHGEKSSVTDKLALSYLHLTLCDPERAEGSLSMISKIDLIKLCVDHHHILHDNFQQLSPLSQLMRRCCPSALTQSLVALHDKGTVSLDLAVQLLQGTSSYEEMYKNTHLKEYLELLLNDVKRRYIFEEAVVILSEMYIKRLNDQKSVVSKQRTAPQTLQLPADEGHFGRRYNWLDYLPPFKGPVEMKQLCQYILRASPTSARRSSAQVKQTSMSHDPCHCALCFEDLIKLQSLLCSSQANESFFNRVMALLSTSVLVPGQDSLLVLILLKTDKQKATDMVVHKYPNIVTEYAKCVMSSDQEQKKIVLDSIYKSLNQQIEKPNDREQMLLTALEEVLDFLAKTTEPEEFLHLLPDNGNFFFFLPYISTNIEQQKNQQLLQTIKDKGNQLHLATS